MCVCSMLLFARQITILCCVNTHWWLIKKTYVGRMNTSDF